MKNKFVPPLFLFFLPLVSGTIFLGFLMHLSPGASSPHTLALSHTLMLLPAFSCMLSKLFTYKKETPAFSFYIFFFIVTIIWIAIIVFDIFTNFNLNIPTLTTRLGIYSSILGYMFLLSMTEEERLRAGLSFQINLKQVVKYILLFIFLYVCATRLRFFIDFLVSQNLNALFVPIAHWEKLPSIFLNFFMGYIVVFGEEYGWRYFLQPILTQKYGLKKGILVVGIIWSIFHIFWDTVALQQPLYSIFFRFIVCISLSYCWGWIYIKTQNIWCIAILHHLNNSLHYIWEVTHEANPYSILVWLVVFFPFVFLLEKKESQSKQYLY